MDIGAIIRVNPILLTSGELRKNVAHLGGNSGALARVANKLKDSGGIGNDQEKKDLIARLVDLRGRSVSVFMKVDWKSWGNANSSLFEKCFIEEGSFYAAIVDAVVGVGLIGMLDWVGLSGMTGVAVRFLVVGLAMKVMGYVRWLCEAWGIISAGRKLEKEYEAGIQRMGNDEARWAYLKEKAEGLESELKDILIATKFGTLLKENELSLYLVDKELSEGYRSLNTKIYELLGGDEALRKRENIASIYIRENESVSLFKNTVEGKTWMWDLREYITSRVGMVWWMVLLANYGWGLLDIIFNFSALRDEFLMVVFIGIVYGVRSMSMRVSRR